MYKKTTPTYQIILSGSLIRRRLILLAISVMASYATVHAQQKYNTDLLIIGGGASGTMAGIQASGMGINTLIIEETEWLGGMLTSAGVSAIDGNHQLPSGLWGEFRQRLYDYYGGPEAVETGWVSNTLFEPSVGNKILKQMVQQQKKLNVWYQTNWTAIKKQKDHWEVKVCRGKKVVIITTRLVIDATELGDVLAAAGVPYATGMDSRAETHEAFAPEKAVDIIQDMTYVVTLKDYGQGADKTIPKPTGYDAAVFGGSCDVSDPAAFGSPQNNCYRMMQYGRLPNNKYMINWPKSGNDYYLNLIEKTPAERAVLLKEAKLHTLRFLYYIQTVLGYKNMGIAEDEYPTADHLPMLPYYRESRRMKGLVTLTLNHISKPYDQPEALYKTGIAVGDYTIDHHHLKNAAAPKIDFVKIKVPSYNIPLGALIPAGHGGLIVAEKSISVTNIVNGASRLQPVVLGIGQAAGALAAVAVRNNVEPAAVNIREVQQALLDSKAYLLPFIDVKPTDKDFQAIQRTGATGILKGTGLPYKWANQTWFYPEREISQYEFVSGLKTCFPKLENYQASGEPLTLGFLSELFHAADGTTDLKKISAEWDNLHTGKPFDIQLKIDRRLAAVLTDHFLNPFALPIDFHGMMSGNNPHAVK